jgi:hypothetical protein
MKKVLLSLLVVLASLALFAVEPVLDVSGTAGFEFKMDESALDIEAMLDADISLDVEFLTTFPATLTAGFTLSPLTVTKNVLGYVTDVSPTLSLDYVQYEQEAWLLRFEPNVIGLSTYTINGDFTDADGALKLGLTDYGVNLVLADLAGNEVTEHATGDFAIPGNWIFGASYDLDVSGVKGLVAGAFKFEDSTNNRVTIEGKVTEVPVPGSLSADVVFGMLNFEDLSGDASSATAYRVNAAYKYPYEMDPITVTPHVGFTWQNNLGTVYAEEVTNGADFSVADTQAVTAGVDLSYLATPITVDLTDALTIDLSEIATPVFSLALTPTVEYAISDLSVAGVEVPVEVADLTDFASTLSITPHGYLTYGVAEVPVTLGADVYYFFKNGEQAKNPIAYMGEVSYALNDYMTAGAHLGNETLDVDSNVIGADTLADLHWYLYFKAEFEF